MWFILIQIQKLGINSKVVDLKSKISRYSNDSAQRFPWLKIVVIQISIPCISIDIRYSKRPAMIKKETFLAEEKNHIFSYYYSEKCRILSK